MRSRRSAPDAPLGSWWRRAGPHRALGRNPRQLQQCLQGPGSADGLSPRRGMDPGRSRGHLSGLPLWQYPGGTAHSEGTVTDTSFHSQCGSQQHRVRVLTGICLAPDMGDRRLPRMSGPPVYSVPRRRCGFPGPRGRSCARVGRVGGVQACTRGAWPRGRRPGVCVTEAGLCVKVPGPGHGRPAARRGRAGGAARAVSTSLPGPAGSPGRPCPDAGG